MLYKRPLDDILMAAQKVEEEAVQLIEEEKLSAAQELFKYYIVFY